MTNSTIENANLNETTIRYANMKNAQIIHVDLTGTTVRASNLSEMNMEGNAWWDMRMNRCDVYGLNFDAGTLEGATVANSHLVNLTIDNCVIDGLKINSVLIKELIENHPDYRFNGESIPKNIHYNEAGERI
ncbi:pentapeptide repeat-containing protein [Cohnella sp. WQ 127256]|uniref:pentapeptide repeat-containing protein n=1 Tax=Cohnella sp. WQ 127256 TaxID=2938790 RepID=UPI00211941A5|nr:pentapeptide repeat-containing protein [Cohnella sp. WQ 127256]